MDNRVDDGSGCGDGTIFFTFAVTKSAFLRLTEKVTCKIKLI